MPQDPTAPSRKKDHIELAFKSQITAHQIDGRFFYEPLLAAHPSESEIPVMRFLGKSLKAPVWVSSMTGGTELARTINQNLARACRDFGMGMGLGSCRSLLYNNDYLADFNVRSIIGDDQLLFANLGIAQVEELVVKKEIDVIKGLIDKLKADGLIIHVNPMQEWLQPEGDQFKRAPIEVIEEVLGKVDFPLVVKEVGQGMGYHSLKALLKLPLAAVEFAAHGGTNFARLELLRGEAIKKETYSQLALVGHSAEEMVDITNQITMELGDQRKCDQLIISGGVKNFLDGYYLIQKAELPAVYGQASGFLKHARGEYEALFNHVKSQVEGLALAYAYLRIRNKN